MAMELTREELFELVWERPMTKVAADYGISDVALKKICDKHRIPVPGRGYWAKKAAGKKVQRAHFRAVTDATVSRIMIHGSPAQRLPETVKEARLAAKQRERRPENKVEVVPSPPRPPSDGGEDRYEAGEGQARAQRAGGDIRS